MRPLPTYRLYQLQMLRPRLHSSYRRGWLSGSSSAVQVLSSAEPHKAVAYNFNEPTGLRR